MLTVFCLRLAGGTIAALLLLSPRVLPAPFFRTHFLIALGPTAVATAFGWSDATGSLRGLLLGANVLALSGSAVWSLTPAPGGRTLIALTAATIAAALGAIDHFEPVLLAADLTSAALLGTALTAMLIGHSYLIAPGMSLTPLFRLLAAWRRLPPHGRRGLRTLELDPDAFVR